MSFAVGDHGDIGGVHWRVVKGRKAPDDLRLEFRAVSFVPVKMAVGFLEAEFYFENENTIFPPPRFEGGERYMKFLRGATVVGWEAAAAQLEDERRRAAERRKAA